MDSLEERVSVFYYENSESNRNPSDYESYISHDEGYDAKPHRIFFWESQQAVLQEILEQSCSTGSKLRQEVCEITLKVREQASDLCRCHKPLATTACGMELSTCFVIEDSKPHHANQNSPKPEKFREVLMGTFKSLGVHLQAEQSKLYM